MNGPQHYREAERLLTQSTEDNPVTAAEAQAHATLALAAAIALQQVGIPGNPYQLWTAYAGGGSGA